MHADLAICSVWERVGKTSFLAWLVVVLTVLVLMILTVIVVLVRMLS